MKNFHNSILVISTLILLNLYGCSSSKAPLNPTDTIPFEKFLDNYGVDSIYLELFKKPYKKWILCERMSVTDPKGNLIKNDNEAVYTLGLTATNEPIPKEVVILEIRTTELFKLKRVYFLESVLSTTNVPFLDDYAESLHGEMTLTSWSGYYYKVSESSSNILRVKVSIIIFSRRDEIVLIQIAEPWKNIYSYFPYG